MVHFINPFPFEICDARIRNKQEIQQYVHIAYWTGEDFPVVVGKKKSPQDLE